MSLLEDVFLNDEAGEAQELERVIEGDEFDERPRSPENSDENSEKEDEAAEDKRRVDPNAKAKRIVKNPRFILNPARLTGPRGIQVIPEHFKDFKFKGKGNEKEDLNMVLKKLEHWAYRLYPKFQFEDCLKKIETLGKKRPVMVHLHKIRSDQFLSDETVVQKDSSDDETTAPPPVQEEDEFDKLLQQQIELARATPAPGSVKKLGLSTPASVDKRSSLTMPKATSSPSINDEQKERMIRNRRLAEERRLARLKQNSAPTFNLIVKCNSIEEEPVIINDMDIGESRVINSVSETQSNIDMTEKNANMLNKDVIIDLVDTLQVRKVNRSNVIDSDNESDTGNVIDITEQGPNISHKKADTRKGNRSNVIDSDGESDTGTNVIDITEQGPNISYKKADKSIGNRPNVIDSDGESDTGNKVVDITKQGPNLSHKKAGTRKGNRSNVIDSDGESDTGTNVIDITEQGPNMSHKKADTRKGNRSNVIDSDGESDTGNNVIDITEQGPNISHKKAGTRKGNRSNVIDSDGESDTGTNVIDITEQGPNMSHKKADTRKGNRSNVIDSDGESDTGNNVIDITEQGPNISHKKADTRKGNRSNVIDSDGESDTGNNVIDITEQGPNISHKKADRSIGSNVIDSDGESKTRNNIIDVTEPRTSPYRQTKKINVNKSNVIDSADSDNNDSNNLVIDINDDSNIFNKGIDARKFYKSTAINSDDESEKKNDKSKSPKNLVIDITKQDIRVPNNEVNELIDSSDDEEMSAIHSISVDVHVSDGNCKTNVIDAEMKNAETKMYTNGDNGKETEVIGQEKNDDFENKSIEKSLESVENKSTNQDIEEGRKKFVENEEVAEIMDIDFSDDF